MDILILAEKGEQGRKIAKGLGLSRRQQNTLTGNWKGKDITVCWAAGHLIDPITPDQAKEDINWRDPNSLVPLPTPGKLTATPANKKKVNAIKALSKQAKTVWIATDPDREGEGIGRNIIKICQFKGDIKRMWLADSLEPGDIQKAANNVLDGSETIAQWRAQQARQGADWLWQFLVRAYTMQGRAGLMGSNLGQAKRTKSKKKAGKASVVSVGRVQTATLKMIVDRDKAIDSFTPINHFTHSVTVNDCDLDYTPPKEVEPGEGRQFDDKGKVYFTNEQQAEDFRQALEGNNLTITGAKAGQKAKKPPLPHSLTTLQKTLSKKYGILSGETLKIADKIRLDGYLTYPRTEHGELPLSLYNADDIAAQMQAAMVVDELAPYAKTMLEQHPGGKPPAAYTKKPMEHHGIVPTGKKPPLNQWSKKEVAVFTECAKALVVALHPPATYNTLTVSGEVATKGMGGETPAVFKKTFSQCVDQGWHKVTGEKDSFEPLPDFTAGEALTITAAQIHAKKTKPPAVFTESSLLNAMLNAGRMAEGEDAKVLKGVSGIGTPATRAAIIDKLLSREYITLKKRKITATPKGHDLIAYTPAQLGDVRLTAQWERNLKAIEEAPTDQEAMKGRNDFLNNQKKFIHQFINEVIKTMNDNPNSTQQRSNKPTDKMIAFVRKIGTGLSLDTTEAEASFDNAKAFIDAHKNEYENTRPPSDKMVNFARKLADENGLELPDKAETSFNACKQFLDKHAG